MIIKFKFYKFILMVCKINFLVNSIRNLTFSIEMFLEFLFKSDFTNVFFVEKHGKSL